MSTPLSPLLSTNTQSPCRNNIAIENAKTTNRSICMQLAHQVNTFLENEATTPLLERVQVQTRITLKVIHTALKQYRYGDKKTSYKNIKSKNYHQHVSVSKKNSFFYKDQRIVYHVFYSLFASSFSAIIITPRNLQSFLSYLSTCPYLLIYCLSK